MPITGVVEVRVRSGNEPSDMAVVLAHSESGQRVWVEADWKTRLS